ncbi:hypothetical protein SJ05684_c09550 [Sinorhizobium sojae CCBAU 05684]|uniref:Uncharacterized protein n=1 Tax=Sinorhizobium sojae CCBAU 05684 TaxID=716928 RepID=A0A249P9Q8_9HYPH|nr:hypothetical protein SJ05684_c09550 [Sinorhizobium sojae CCBAU 05684]
MRQHQPVELGVVQETRTAAGAAPPGEGGLFLQAVSAEARNRCSAVSHVWNKC